ncbi:MAG: hypothetical protein HQ567_04195 [Candidatus Nealsonbacteria bacterium]|nr:hypothetical protein [Candidatus Nealsonbacteria bacterium]
MWDDDDIYLPWHLEAMTRVFESLSDEVWLDRRTTLQRKKTGGLFHGSWGFTREALLPIGGYPPMQSGQDQALAGRFRAAGVGVTSPEGLPSYIYRWFTHENARHISALGKDGYERCGQEPIVRRKVVVPGWERDWEGMVGEIGAAG